MQSPGRTQLGETGNVTHKTQHKMAGHRDTDLEEPVQFVTFRSGKGYAVGYCRKLFMIWRNISRPQK